MSERGARIVRRCSEITIATWRRSGGTGGSAPGGADPAGSLPSAPQSATSPEVGLPVAAVERGSIDSPISGRCYGWIAETTKRRPPEKLIETPRTGPREGLPPGPSTLATGPPMGRAHCLALMGTARIARCADFSFRKSGRGRTPQRLPCPDHQPAHSAEACRRALSGRHRARWLLRDVALRKAMQPPLQNDS